MPLPLLHIISSAARYVGKNALKNAGLKILDSGGIKTLNTREDYVVKNIMINLLHYTKIKN